MIAHIMVFCFTLSFALGIAVFFQYLLIYLKFRPPILKSYLIVQICISICILITLCQRYVLTNINDSSTVMIITTCITILWAPFFFYNFAKFYHQLTQLPFTGTRRSICLAITILLGLSAGIPFMIGRDVSGILHLLENLDYLVIIPTCVLICIIMSLMMTIRYHHLKDLLIKKIVRINLLVNYLFVPPILIFYLTRLTVENLLSITVFFSLNLYFLAWNTASFLLFITHSGEIDRHLFKAKRNPISGNGNLQLEEASEMVQMLENFMETEKPYLNPELTLTVLADMLSITRNKLSQILNQHSRINFYDYINSYRIIEVEHLLSKKMSNILETAFRAGFNSKTTFYSAFKKKTGMSPKDYLQKLKAGQTSPNVPRKGL